DARDRRARPAADAVVEQGPGGVLARRAAAESRPRHQDLRAARLRPGEREVRPRVPVLVVAPAREQPAPQPGPRGPLEVARRDDLIGIDVRPRENGDARVEPAEGLQGHRRYSRGSAIAPATAAAAALSVLARNVRPPAPSRPATFLLPA